MSLSTFLSDILIFRFTSPSEKAKVRRQAERALIEEGEYEKDKDMDEDHANETTALYVPGKDGEEGHVRVRLWPETLKFNDIFPAKTAQIG